jgi:hypothetical protein
MAGVESDFQDALVAFDQLRQICNLSDDLARVAFRDDTRRQLSIQVFEVRQHGQQIFDLLDALHAVIVLVTVVVIVVVVAFSFFVCVCHGSLKY